MSSPLCIVATVVSLLFTPLLGARADAPPSTQVCISASSLTQLLSDNEGNGLLAASKHKVDLSVEIAGGNEHKINVYLRTRSKVVGSPNGNVAPADLPEKLQAFSRIHQLADGRFFAGQCELTDEQGTPVKQAEFAKCLSYLLTAPGLVPNQKVNALPIGCKPLGTDWIRTRESFSRVLFQCDNADYKTLENGVQVFLKGRVWRLLFRPESNNETTFFVTEYPLATNFEIRKNRGKLSFENPAVSLELTPAENEKVQKIFDDLTVAFDQAVQSMNADLGLPEVQVTRQEFNGKNFLVFSDKTPFPINAIAKENRQQGLLVYFSQDFLNRVLAKYLTSPQIGMLRLVVLPTECVPRRSVLEVFSVKNMIGGEKEKTLACTLPLAKATDEQKDAVKSEGLKIELQPVANKFYDSIQVKGKVLAVLRDAPVLAVEGIDWTFRIFEDNQNGGGFKIEGRQGRAKPVQALPPKQEVQIVDPRIPSNERSKNRVLQLIEGLYGLASLISEADPIPSLNDFATTNIHFGGWTQEAKWKNAGGRVVEAQNQTGLLLYGDLSK